MRAVVQRVSRASVTVDGRVVGAIDNGLMILLGVGREDGEAEAIQLAKKIAGLRIFEDDQGKMNLDASQIDGSALVVSQFTLWADTKKGRRPSFIKAGAPEIAEPLYQFFTKQLNKLGLATAQGIFGAHMAVELINDGPVTLILDTDEWNR